MAEFTRKVARKHSRPHVAAIKARLVRMAGHWGDLDMTVVGAIEEVGRALEELETTMDEAVELEEEKA